jgi:hypothetical protein
MALKSNKSDNKNDGEKDSHHFQESNKGEFDIKMCPNIDVLKVFVKIENISLVVSVIFLQNCQCLKIFLFQSITLIANGRELSFNNKRHLGN